MSKTYYNSMKDSACAIRQEFELTTYRIMINDLRRIYKEYEIDIDLWPRDTKTKIGLRGLRGAFFYDDCGASVLINRNLPSEPRVFTMGHELKHYLHDRDRGELWCGDNNTLDEVEIGAEIFAAELIFPDDNFATVCREMGIREGNCLPEHIVHMKRATQTTLPYIGLVKKTEFHGYIQRGDFRKVKWKKLEEEIFGVPSYKKRQGA